MDRLLQIAEHAAGDLEEAVEGDDLDSIEVRVVPAEGCLLISIAVPPYDDLGDDFFGVLGIEVMDLMTVVIETLQVVLSLHRNHVRSVAGYQVLCEGS